ncbi:MAG: hypothetical protein M0036_06495 [Desulfobacteraceae bacterium]|nr:hypothetical protein [Desulfobacteraceae bacterium]
MSGISSVSSTPPIQVRQPANPAPPDGSPAEEAKEPTAEKERELSSPQAEMQKEPTAKGVGGVINLLA